jgi:hypothetical protein
LNGWCSLTWDHHDTGSARRYRAIVVGVDLTNLSRRAVKVPAARQRRDVDNDALRADLGALAIVSMAHKAEIAAGTGPDRAFGEANPALAGLGADLAIAVNLALGAEWLVDCGRGCMLPGLPETALLFLAFLAPALLLLPLGECLQWGEVAEEMLGYAKSGGEKRAPGGRG